MLYKIQRRVFKDLHKRIAFQKIEEQKRILLILRKSEDLRETDSWWKVLPELSKIGGKGSITRIRNVCRITGRTRGVLSHFGLSRLEWRRRADTGEIPGIRRASW